MKWNALQKHIYSFPPFTMNERIVYRIQKDDMNENEQQNGLSATQVITF